MEEVRFGIVGAGAIAKYHNRVLAELPETRVTAVTDVVSDRARSLAADSSAEVFPDHREMIKSGKVDAIAVTTPHGAHPEITTCALERGIHVYCEKPLAVHVKAARPMLEAARRSPAKFAVGFQRRSRPVVRKAREMIAGEELGALRRAIMLTTVQLRTQAYYDSDGWRGTWDGEGGGVLLNQTSHDLDIFQWLVGMPARVRAFVSFGKYHNIEVEDDVTAYMEWDGGMTGLFVTTTGEFPGTDRFEIHGDRGRLILENNTLVFDRSAKPVAEHVAHSQRLGGPACETIEIPVTGEGGGWECMYANFIGAILRDEPLISPGVEGIHSLELGNAMILSGVREETVALPLDGDAYERFLEDSKQSWKPRRIVTEPRKR